MLATAAYKGHDRRAFLRMNYEAPVEVKVLSNVKDANPATSRNISQTGILFSSEHLVPLSSMVWLNLDINTLSICSEIEENSLIYKNGIVGKVVRVDEADDGNYDIGVCFVKKSAPEAEKLKSLLTNT